MAAKSSNKRDRVSDISDAQDAPPLKQQCLSASDGENTDGDHRLSVYSADFVRDPDIREAAQQRARIDHSLETSGIAVIKEVLTKEETTQVNEIIVTRMRDFVIEAARRTTKEGECEELLRTVKSSRDLEPLQAMELLSLIARRPGVTGSADSGFLYPPPMRPKSGALHVDAGTLTGLTVAYNPCVPIAREILLALPHLRPLLGLNLTTQPRMLSHGSIKVTSRPSKGKLRKLKLTRSPIDPRQTGIHYDYFEAKEGAKIDRVQIMLFIQQGADKLCFVPESETRAKDRRAGYTSFKIDDVASLERSAIAAPDNCIVMWIPGVVHFDGRFAPGATVDPSTGLNRNPCAPSKSGKKYVLDDKLVVRVPFSTQSRATYRGTLRDAERLAEHGFIVEPFAGYNKGRQAHPAVYSLLCKRSTQYYCNVAPSERARALLTEVVSHLDKAICECRECRERV